MLCCMTFLHKLAGLKQVKRAVSPVRLRPVIWSVTWPTQVQVLLQNLLAEFRHLALTIFFLLTQLALPRHPPLLLVFPLSNH